MFDGILAQSFLNLRGVFCAFKIHPAETQRAVHKVDVTIDETREHKFSAGVDDFCAHATPALDFRVVTDHGDLAVANGHGLGPRLLGVFGVNATVNDDDIRRFDDPALRARHPGRGTFAGSSFYEPIYALIRPSSDHSRHRCSDHSYSTSRIISISTVRPGFFQRCGRELSKYRLSPGFK